MSNSKIEIEIPDSLLTRIKKLVQDNEKFSKIDDYLVYSARKTLVEDAGNEYIVSDEEKEEVKKKLKSLGYID